MCRLTVTVKRFADFTVSHPSLSIIVNELSKALQEGHPLVLSPSSDREALSFAADEAAIDCHDRTIIILDTLYLCIAAYLSHQSIARESTFVCHYISLPIYNVDPLFQSPRCICIKSRFANEKYSATSIIKMIEREIK